MKKCIVIPDSFKGTMSAIEICTIMENSIKKIFPDCEVITIPVADGGEGTVDCFLHALQAQKIEVITTNPFNEPITAYYARAKNTAIIEMASAAGLPQAENRLNPRITTTYGVGTIIRHAVEKGCNKIILGLGGSCTNDGGVGMAQSLGTVFINKEGKEFTPTADTLDLICSIDNSKTEQLLNSCEIIAMCDIDNPLFGPNGAAYIFGPQKGADAATVKLLDKNLKALGAVIEQSLHKSISNIKGAGAAGGMGAGVAAFLNGELKPGIDLVLSLIDFDEKLDGTDMVFTGEGRVDSQSLRGKVVIGVAKACKSKNVPVTVITGSIGEGAEEVYNHGVHAIFSINRNPVAFEKSRHHSKENLQKTMEDIMRFANSIH